jgi:hypothetical protein
MVAFVVCANAVEASANMAQMRKRTLTGTPDMVLPPRVSFDSDYLDERQPHTPAKTLGRNYHNQSGGASAISIFIGFNR